MPAPDDASIMRPTIRPAGSESLATARNESCAPPREAFSATNTRTNNNGLARRIAGKRDDAEAMPKVFFMFGPRVVGHTGGGPWSTRLPEAIPSHDTTMRSLRIEQRTDAPRSCNGRV